MTDFKLIPDKKLGIWIDVQYPDEERPRYMMNIERKTCTCIGSSLGKDCKHLKEYFNPQENAPLE